MEYTETSAYDLENPLEFFMDYGKFIRTNKNLKRTRNKKKTKTMKIPGMTGVLTREFYLIGLVILSKILRTWPVPRWRSYWCGYRYIISPSPLDRY